MLAKAEAGSFSFRLVAGSRRSTACSWVADRVLLHAAERAQCCSLPVVVALCIACTAIGRGCSFHNCGSTTVPNNALPLQVKGTLNTVTAQCEVTGELNKVRNNRTKAPANLQIYKQWVSGRKAGELNKVRDNVTASCTTGPASLWGKTAIG